MENKNRRVQGFLRKMINLILNVYINFLWTHKYVFLVSSQIIFKNLLVTLSLFENVYDYKFVVDTNDSNRQN